MSEEVQVPKRRGRPPKVASPVVRESKRPMFKMQADIDSIDPTSRSITDRFYISPNDIPEGVELQWVRWSSMGKADDPNVQAKTQAGWRPVCHGDIDGRFDNRYDNKKDGEPLTVDGSLGLFWMPKELYAKIKAREYKEARERVILKERDLKGGGMNVSLDATHPSAVSTNRIGKSFERLDIPKE